MSQVRAVIVGRPNVGKSTLFNRLVGRRRALVHNLPGVTRDRIDGKMQIWSGGLRYDLLLTDTGGMGGEVFAQEIDAQVRAALTEADIVLFLMDGTQPSFQDQELHLKLKRAGVFNKIPVIGIVNKVDVHLHEGRINDFYSMGIEPLVTISAEHDRGVEDLKDLMIKVLGTSIAGYTPNEDDVDPSSVESTSTAVDLTTQDQDEQGPGHLGESSESNELDDLDELDPDSLDSLDSLDSTAPTDDLDQMDHSDVQPRIGAKNAEYDLLETGVQDLKAKSNKRKYAPKIPRISIVGRPNVGKSTLLNTLLGHQRVITSSIAGTTVDAIDTAVVHEGKTYCLVDTAGIRRKGKTNQGVEVLSVVQATKSLDHTDLAILVLDGERGISDQDEKIAGMIEQAGCSIILLMNKWDTQSNNPKFTQKLASEKIRREFRFLNHAPIIFVSAAKNQGLENLWDLVGEILTQRALKISTREFTDWIRVEATIHNPMNAKFYLCHQTGRNPPTFVCHVNEPKRIDFSLKRHLVNAMRDRWGFMGSPVRLLFVEGSGAKLKAKKA